MSVLLAAFGEWLVWDWVLGRFDRRPAVPYRSHAPSRGSSERIFDGVGSFDFEPVQVLHSRLAAHIRYRRIS